MSTAETAPVEGVLFEGGPPDKLQTWLGLIRQNRPRLLLRAGLVILLAWVPLAVLSFAHGDLLDRPGGGGFVSDFAVHTRYLLAAPLLVLAEAVCLPQLTAIAWQFLATGIIAEPDYPKFQQAIASTRRLMNSTVVEIAAILLAYGLVGILFLGKPPEELPPWHGALSGGSLSYFAGRLVVAAGEPAAAAAAGAGLAVATGTVDALSVADEPPHAAADPCTS